MTHGCTDCGYDYMDKCEVYDDGTCKRDRAEAYKEAEASTGGNRMTVFYTGCDLVEKDGTCVGCYRYEICKEAKEKESEVDNLVEATE